MKLKCWPRYLAHYAASWCRDTVSPTYPVEEITADFFVSMGTNCRTATQLRRHNLRICSSPLDWMKNYTLKDAAELFRTGFSTFFADIRERPDIQAGGGRGRTVEDLQNGMISIHHFPHSMSLEEGQALFRERAARHFANTRRFMSESGRFVMVTNSTESIDDICHFITVMKSLYPAEIIHINIRHGTEKKREKITLPDDSILYDYTFHDVAVVTAIGAWGNNYEWRKILGQCRRTQKFSLIKNTEGDF